MTWTLLTDFEKLLAQIFRTNTVLC